MLGASATLGCGNGLGGTYERNLILVCDHGALKSLVLSWIDLPEQFDLLLNGDV